MSNPLTLAIVIESLGGGGAQKAAVNLAHKWCQDGNSVTFVLFSQDSDICYDLPKSANLRFLRHTWNKKRGRVTTNILRILALRKVLKDISPDIVLTMVSTTNTIGCLASIGTDWRLVISERNDPSRQKIGKIWEVLRTLSYPLADLITANSQVALDFLATTNNPEKLVYVPNIVMIKQEPKHQIAERDIPVKFLAVGRLHPQKRYDVLLDAIGIAKKSSQDFHLTVLGDGPLAAKLRDKCKNLGLQQHVTWHGYRTDTEAFYKTHQVFILASDYEGSSNALLEAMTCGLSPIISDSQEGSLQYVEADNNGAVFSQGDAHSLAEKILLYCQNRNILEEHCANAREAAKSFGDDNAYRAWKIALIGDKHS